MNIYVGSTNPVKESSVRRIIREHVVFAHASVYCRDAVSGVSDQPLCVEDMVEGAHNRAYGAYSTRDGEDENACFGIGIESGVFLLDMYKRERLLRSSVDSLPFIMAVCSLYDGQRYYEGLSPLAECPRFVFDHVVKHGVTLDTAVHQLGLTDDPRIGIRSGIIYALTRGQMTRQQQLEIAVNLALSRFEERELYDHKS